MHMQVGFSVWFPDLFKLPRPCEMLTCLAEEGLAACSDIFTSSTPLHCVPISATLRGIPSPPFFLSVCREPIDPHVRYKGCSLCPEPRHSCLGMLVVSMAANRTSYWYRNLPVSASRWLAPRIQDIIPVVQNARTHLVGDALLLSDMVLVCRLLQTEWQCTMVSIYDLVCRILH